MSNSKLIFDLELDVNNVPQRITMNSSDKQADDVHLKSLMVAGWDSKTKETLRVDLWTKDMMVNEMFIMYHQTLMSMANTLEKSTGHDRLAGALRDYCEFFAEQTKIIDKSRVKRFIVCFNKAKTSLFLFLFRRCNKYFWKKFPTFQHFCFIFFRFLQSGWNLSA